MHPLPLVAAAVLAIHLYRRRAKHSKRTLALGALAVAALLAFGTGVIPTPDVERFAAAVGETLGKWTYLVVGVLAFAETGAFVGLIAPGETAVILGGVIAGQGVIDPVVLIAITWACATAGDVTSYALGRKLGRGFLVRHGPRMRITEERLEQVDRFFDRRGGATILIGRFIGLVRALAPFLAGAARMDLRRFVPYDVIGAGLWSAAFVMLGYFFWQSFDRVTDYAGRGAFALGTAVALVATVVFAHRLERDPELRARTRAWLLARRGGPLLLELARRAGGPARFVLDRLTPGGLGLELTTLAAIALAGGFAFVVLGVQMDRTALLPGDRIAFDVLEPVRAQWVDDILRIVTDLGAFPVMAAATLATAAWAMRRRRAVEALTLPIGLLLTLALVQLAKDGFGRPRPLEPVINSAGLAYPSGHVAYATALVACAVVLVRAGSSAALRLGAVAIALGLVALVGTTRLYLRVHYLSDVIGGAALGLATFSVCGIAALVIDFRRQS